MRLLSLLLGLCIAMLVIINSSAEAACSGGGTTWTCTASNNAVITLASGNYALGGDVNFLTSKGASIICATEGACTVTGGIIGMNGTCSGTMPYLYRISGLVFSGGATRSWWWGPGPCTVQQFRIDHNTFTGQTPGQVIIYFGESGSLNNYFFGVVDHNTITNAQTVSFIQSIQGSNNTPTADKLGGASNIFVEDNTMNITTLTDNGTGMLDGWGGHGVVARFNKLTNTRVLQHGTSGTWGPINFEVYFNTIKITSASDSYVQFGNRLVHHQGSGTYMIFENQFQAMSPQDGDPIVVQHSGSSTSAGQPRPDGTVCNGSAAIDGNRPGKSGYPCFRQPGRDVDRTLKPMYVWRNRWTNNSNLIGMSCQGYSSMDCSAHILNNRDYYNAVSANAQTTPTSPFNGTTGMGFGTLANRPTTCTTGPEAADAGNGGVGYWATDVGEWNSSNGTAPDGQLYICSATNTWSLYYKPYTYPHPLQLAGGTGGGSASTPPSSPQNLRVQ
jgi:hypothetical protein